MFNYYQVARLLEVLGINSREKLYAYAQTCVGRHLSDPVDPVFGCAQSVNNLFKECFGSPIGGGASTLRMYQALLASPRFAKMTPPEQAKRGDIIISPTGYGSGKVPNGHVGILGDKDGEIFSNNSNTGEWDTHLDTSKWISHYVIEGGYPMCIFRVIY